MSKNEDVLLKKILKKSQRDENRLDIIFKKIAMLELNDRHNIKLEELCVKSKKINEIFHPSLLDQYFLLVEKNINHAETTIKFVHFYVQNILIIIDQILKLLCEINNESFMAEHETKLVNAIKACIVEIDEIVSCSYYKGQHLLYLTGVDKETTIVFNLFHSANTQLNLSANKFLENDFIIRMPMIDAVSLGLYSYKECESNNGDINLHIKKFGIAHDMIISELSSIEKFKEILRYKKESFELNKLNIIVDMSKN